MSRGPGTDPKGWSSKGRKNRQKTHTQRIIGNLDINEHAGIKSLPTWMLRKHKDRAMVGLSLAGTADKENVLSVIEPTCWSRDLLFVLHALPRVWLGRPNQPTGCIQHRAFSFFAEKFVRRMRLRGVWEWPARTSCHPGIGCGNRPCRLNTVRRTA